MSMMHLSRNFVGRGVKVPRHNGVLCLDKHREPAVIRKRVEIWQSEE